jgi:hypothetical protein
MGDAIGLRRGLTQLAVDALERYATDEAYVAKMCSEKGGEFCPPRPLGKGDSRGWIGSRPKDTCNVDPHPHMPGVADVFAAVYLALVATARVGGPAVVQW